MSSVSGSDLFMPKFHCMNGTAQICFESLIFLHNNTIMFSFVSKIGVFAINLFYSDVGNDYSVSPNN